MNGVKADYSLCVKSRIIYGDERRLHASSLIFEKRVVTDGLSFKCPIPNRVSIRRAWKGIGVQLTSQTPKQNHTIIHLECTRGGVTKVIESIAGPGANIKKE
jgi:hypothetical protein